MVLVAVTAVVSSVIEASLFSNNRVGKACALIEAVLCKVDILQLIQPTQPVSTLCGKLVFDVADSDVEYSRAKVKSNHRNNNKNKYQGEL